jgi:hypothetical protein
LSIYQEENMPVAPSSRWASLGKRVLSIIGAVSLVGCATSGPPPPAPTYQVAVGQAPALRIVRTDTFATVFEDGGYSGIRRVAYSPDGQRLAVAECIGQQYRLALYTPGDTSYESLGAIQQPGCIADLAYSPDSQTLAMTIRTAFAPGTLTSLALLGPGGGSANVSFSQVQPAAPLAYRPGGGEIAVGSVDDVRIFATTAGLPLLVTIPATVARRLAYTRDGARLLVATATGFTVFDAAAGYQALTAQGDAAGGVSDIAVDPAGAWVALLRGTAASVHRAPDLVAVTTLTAGVDSFRDATFAPDGATLAIAEGAGRVRFWQAATWTEGTALTATSPVNAIAYRPPGTARIPAVFVHGHSNGAAATWFDPAASGTTSVARGLARNPHLGIDAFYVEMPVHGDDFQQNESRSIADDALDLLALIEGGADSRGAVQVGLLNMPAYVGAGKVALVGYSQGGLSARYYLANLMGSRQSGAVTVSSFVALATPNHGTAGVLVCDNASEPDRARRQLCNGRVSTLSSSAASCGQGVGTPAAFSTNQAGDLDFVTNLNGGTAFSPSCGANPIPSEAPHSRPTTPGGVLYASFYAAGNADLLAGGDSYPMSCGLGVPCDSIGRRLARNLATDARNREFNGVSTDIATGGVHGNFPHYDTVICATLRTIVDHVVPADINSACSGLATP